MSQARLSARRARGASRRAFLALLAATCVAVPARAAHNATPLKIVREAEIDAPAAKVWSVVADFQHWSWLPDVSEIQGSGGVTPDKDWRRLTLASGAGVEESLTRFEPERMMLGYHIDHIDLSVLPVTNYTAILTVRESAPGKAVVEWKARFYRGWPNANPPPELNDDVAEKAVAPVVEKNLAALKAKVEGK